MLVWRMVCVVETEDMVMKPYDVVEYWHGHEEFGAIGVYSVPDERYCELVINNILPEWDLIQFKLRNGQIIKVRKK